MDDEAVGDDGLMEVKLGAARIRIGREAEVGMALAVIGALQFHRFSRRAETLPANQLELSLVDVEQVEAEGEARVEATKPGKKTERAKVRRAGRGALLAHQPGIETIVDLSDTIFAAFDRRACV